MNLERLRKDLVEDEGYRLTAYPDPLTKAAPYTCGIGCTHGVTKDTVWTPEQVEDHYTAAVQEATAGLDRICPWWRGLDAARQNVLLNMCYQMGAAGLAKFKLTLCYVCTAAYASAAKEMLNSEWAKQTPQRAHRLAKQMETGEYRDGL